MRPQLHHVAFPPQILPLGFWLYISTIGLRSGADAYYVGMTGDTGSSVAQSPFSRAAAHLGSNTKNNTLSRYLQKRGFKPDECAALDFFTCGPLYQSTVPSDPEAYRAMRGKVAALEKKLYLTLESHGLELLNARP